MHSFWTALFAGRIVSPAGSPRWCDRAACRTEDSRRYGLGFWLHETSDLVMLDGFDAGVSFRSSHDHTRGVTYTVVGNDCEGVWPMTKLLAAQV